MAKATIKSKTGATITIDGSDSEVSRIIVAFESTAKAIDPTFVQAKEVAAKTRTAKREAKMRMGASDLIVRLKEESFFEQTKSIAEIAKALEEQGFLYPVTSLSGILLSLVQKRLLRRKKADGKYVYGK